jgi:hypothetical protein
MNIEKFFTNYLLGNFGDNSWLLWEGLRRKYNLYTNNDLGLFGYSNNSLITEPLTYYPFLFLSNFINAILLWNIFIILFTGASFYFSYKLIKKNNHTFDAILLSLIWISNSYFSFHSREHLSLMAGFLFPIYLLLEDRNKKPALIFKYLFLIISLGISNYIGVFLIFINSIYSIYKYFKEKNKINLINLTAGLSLCLSLSAGLKYLFPSIERNLDNFLIFSFKPWHLFIQPKRALVNLYNTENYLNFKNNILFTYFENEHSASFFGFIILILLGLALWRKYKDNFDNLFLLLSTLIITLPPVVTIKNLNIYTPSYIFYFLFDQFRVTSRFNIFSFLLILLIISSLFKDLGQNIKIKIIKLLLTILIILEIFVPFKITYTNSDTSIYKYLRENTTRDSQIIVYPYEKTNTTFKDMIFIQRKIINPAGYTSLENNFSAKEFTQNLSCTNIRSYTININNLYLINFDTTEKIDLEKDNLEKVLEENKITLSKINCQ